MTRSRFPAPVAFAAFAALEATLTIFSLLFAAAPAHAQQTTSVGSLYLSNGAELDFRLFSAVGGAGTNGTNSDRITSSSVFNYSSASPGNYIVGFSHGDGNPLLPGSLYTLVTFGSTNFTAADGARFTAAPRGNVGAVSGNFILNPGTGVGGSGGTLQFQLTAASDMPEPTDLWLIVPGALMVAGMFTRNARKERRRRATA